MRLCVLGSGSAGNAYAIQSAGGAWILLDCGFSYRELTKRLAARGLTPDDFVSVFFTHDHSDHCRGLAVFHKHHPRVPLFANGMTADAIAAAQGVPDGWVTFETAESFPLSDFTVTSFSVPHDAADSVGYLFESGGHALFVGTDMGKITFAARDAFSRADAAVLESNHDPVLLETSTRPPELKRRIAGPSGHLSNGDAAAFVREALPPQLKTLLLAHLSRECNSPSLAQQAMADVLAALRRPDVHLEILSQDTPSAVFEF